MKHKKVTNSKKRPTNKVKMRYSCTHNDAIKPTYANTHAAGLDFYAREDVTIGPGEMVKISTGIMVEVPETHYLQIEGRSGLSIKGMNKVGSGIIDPDYRGELNIPLENKNNEPYEIERGHRIAQAVLHRREPISLVRVTELPETVRGNGGFGSTGK